MKRHVTLFTTSALAALLACGTARGQVPTVHLSPTERIGDANAVNEAQPGFKIKTVFGPPVSNGNCPVGEHYPVLQAGDLYWMGQTAYLDWSRLEAWTSVPRNFIDFLGDANPSPATPGAVNFVNDGSAAPFPGVPTNGEQFGVRAEGFIVLAAGTYRVGLDAADEGYLWIGRQALASTWWDTTVFPPGTPQEFDLVVTEPGTYPIRVEVFHQFTIPATGAAHAHLYQVVEGNRIDVGAGNMPVYQALANKAYAGWRTHGVSIPAARKVAESGQGEALGWNVKLSMAAFDIVGFPPGWPPAWNLGHGTIVSENDRGGQPTAYSEETGTPLFLNYSRPDIDPYSYNGRFYDWHDGVPPTVTNQNSLMAFSNYAAYVSGSPTYITPSFAIAADGYIEFPAPGDYGINTTCRDGCAVWIGGKIVQFWYGDYDHIDGKENAIDRVPTCVHIEEAGLYDIRVEFCSHTYFPLLSFFQYLPDGTAALVNNPPDAPPPSSTVAVYQTLHVTPSSTTYHNPLRLPLSAKVADLNTGAIAGIRAQLVKYAPTSGDTNIRGGVGHDSMFSLPAAHDLLDAVLNDDTVAKLSQQGSVAFDGSVNTIYFGDPDYLLDSASVVPWPTGEVLNTTPFAGRFTGQIGLTAGGHVFALFVNDAADVTIGGMEVARFGTWHDQTSWTVFYVWAPADGYYPIEINYVNFGEPLGPPDDQWNEACLRLLELDTAITGWYPLNTNASVSTLKVACSIPFADMDKDGDVDQRDFGVLQVCFTGNSPGNTLPSACMCLDRDANGDVSAQDLIAFTKCVTGSGIPFNPAAPPEGCNP